MFLSNEIMIFIQFLLMSILSLASVDEWRCVDLQHRSSIESILIKRVGSRNHEATLIHKDNAASVTVEVKKFVFQRKHFKFKGEDLSIRFLKNSSRITRRAEILSENFDTKNYIWVCKPEQ